MATLESFGTDFSKSTKFGPDIPYSISFRFLREPSQVVVKYYYWK